MRNAVFLFRLRCWHFVISAENQFAIDDVVDGVGAPIEGVIRPTTRPGATTPFVCEDDFCAIVIKSSRMPIGETLIDNRINPHWLQRV